MLKRGSRFNLGLGLSSGAGGAADITAPTITSSNALSLLEGYALSHTLTADEAVTWTKTGGADTSLFTLAGDNLSLTARDFDIPTDADTNNTYVVQVTATDAALNATNQTITVTVSDLAAETEALLLRFTTPATAARATLINTLIVALKTAGVWTKYDAFYMPAAETQQAAQRNWVADAYNLTETNSPAWVADRGYTPNGTSSYCDTGFNPVTAVGPKYLQDDAYMGVWHRTDIGGIGATTSNDVGNTLARIVNTTGLQLSIAANRVSVLIGSQNYALDKSYSRTASNAWRHYLSGVLVGANPRTDVSSAMTSFNFGLGRTAAAAAFGLNECSNWRFGSSLTTAEQLDEHNAIQTYMTAVGAG